MSVLSPYHRRSRRQFRREGQPLAASGAVAGKNVCAFRRTARGASPPLSERRGRAWRSFVPAPIAGHYADLRGLYRVFNYLSGTDAEGYRVYYKLGSPPDLAPGDLLSTNPTLPFTPGDTFADGSHYFKMTFWNGCIESNPYPVGPAGEEYLRIIISDGQAGGEPPRDADPWRLEQAASGHVKVLATYNKAPDLLAGGAAGEWAIACTTDGGDPPEHTPDVTQSMSFEGVLATLVKDLDFSAQAHGTTIKVRLQTRRNDSGSWVYSESSVIKSITTDKTGPAAPPMADKWRGRLPEDL